MPHLPINPSKGRLLRCLPRRQGHVPHPLPPWVPVCPPRQPDSCPCLPAAPPPASDSTSGSPAFRSPRPEPSHIRTPGAPRRKPHIPSFSHGPDHPSNIPPHRTQPDMAPRKTRTFPLPVQMPPLQSPQNRPASSGTRILPPAKIPPRMQAHTA